MNRIDERKIELASLPKGYLSIKNIHGKTRYYLQHRENGKVVSQYVKKEDVPSIQKGIARRKEIEAELRNLEKAITSPLLSHLSPNALAITGDIMEEDEVVASFRNGAPLHINEKRAPLEIARTGNVYGWLESRSIDSHRTNSRLLKKVLRLEAKEEVASVLRVYARTITDHFWFRPYKSKAHFQNLLFENDLYANTALQGITRDAPKKPTFNPQLTLTGSYEKCWRLENGTWYMYKSGTENEIFSELFCSSLCQKLGIPTATYEREGAFIKTRNFAEKCDFEPLRSIAGDDDRYETCFPLIDAISPALASQYLLLMWFDCLVYNVDRHNENCGFLRDRKTGDILSLAPNFDNNLALFARDVPTSTDRKSDGLISVFRKFLIKDRAAAKRFASLTLPRVNEEMVQGIVVQEKPPVPEKFLFEYLDNGQRELSEIQNKLKSNLL